MQVNRVVLLEMLYPSSLTSPVIHLGRPCEDRVEFIRRGVAGRGSRAAEATLYVCEAGLRRLKTRYVSAEPAQPGFARLAGGLIPPRVGCAQGFGWARAACGAGVVPGVLSREWVIQGMFWSRWEVRWRLALARRIICLAIVRWLLAPTPHPNPLPKGEGVRVLPRLPSGRWLPAGWARGRDSSI